MRDPGGKMHYGDWFPADGTRVNNTFVATQTRQWLGQYRLRLVACSGSETEAIASAAFIEQPAISINDVTVIEPATGTTNAVFTVKLSKAIDREVTVKYRTYDLIATAPDDYAALALKTLTFKKWTQTQTVVVTVKSDTVPERIERLETFLVQLSDPSKNATIADGRGIGTIHEKCECPARVQLGKKYAVDILNGIPEAWETMSDAERTALKPVIRDALRSFTMGQLSKDMGTQLGKEVGTQFADEYLEPGMLRLYQEVVEFGRTRTCSWLDRMPRPRDSIVQFVDSPDPMSMVF